MKVDFALESSARCTCKSWLWLKDSWSRGPAPMRWLLLLVSSLGRRVTQVEMGALAPRAWTPARPPSWAPRPVVMRAEADERAATLRWVEELVVGRGLCPWAEAALRAPGFRATTVAGDSLREPG